MASPNPIHDPGGDDTIYPWSNDHQAPGSEIEARLEKFRRGLDRMGLDGALITHRVDLFYFTGTAQDGWLWAPVSGSPRLLIRRDLHRARSSYVSGSGNQDPVIAVRSRGLLPGQEISFTD